MTLGHGPAYLGSGQSKQSWFCCFTKQLLSGLVFVQCALGQKDEMSRHLTEAWASQWHQQQQWMAAVAATAAVTEQWQQQCMQPQMQTQAPAQPQGSSPASTEKILGQIALTLAAVPQQAEVQSKQMQHTLARQEELQLKMEQNKDFNDATRDLFYDLKARLETQAGRERAGSVDVPCFQMTFSLLVNSGGGPAAATGCGTAHQFADDEVGEPGDPPGHLQEQATDQGHVEEEGWLLHRMDVPGWYGEVHPDRCHAGVLPQLVAQPRPCDARQGGHRGDLERAPDHLAEAAGAQEAPDIPLQTAWWEQEEPRRAGQEPAKQLYSVF